MLSKNTASIYPFGSMEKPVLINVLLIKVTFLRNASMTLIKNYFEGFLLFRGPEILITKEVFSW